jgi:hypothetical protein
MTPSDDDPRKARRPPPLAQVLLCSGCCCGRTDGGRPAVPIERFKAVWKAEKLNRTVQLTVSGCLGPCELANVVRVMTPDALEWLGRLDGQGPYEALLAWARDCQAAQALRQRPEALARYRFHRFGMLARPGAAGPAIGP